MGKLREKIIEDRDTILDIRKQIIHAISPTRSTLYIININPPIVVATPLPPLKPI